MMYAIVYTHKFGMDVNVADDEASAFEFAEGIVGEWRDDFNVDPELSNGDALQDWIEITNGTECIDVLPVWHIKDFKPEEE